ncbi:MAG: thioredoxin domain-containing protein [Candidatus Binatia bacterium]
MTRRAQRCFFLAGPLLILAALAGGGALAADETVATVDGKPITRAELEQAVRAQLIEIDNSRYQVLEQGLQAMIVERLLAREAEDRGITVVELRKIEIEDKLSKPSEDEIEAVYEENKGQLDGATLDAVSDRIVEFLQSQQAMGLQQELAIGLSEKYDTEIKLEPPVIEVEIGSGPPRGGKPGAPITIVGFSDYECPYCKRGEEVVEQVLNAYGDKVVYYHRDYPLPFHPNARRAAEAARCAGEQGKYWDYHVMLFTSSQLSEERFVEIAESIQIDRAKFDQCLASGRFEAAVDADMAAAAGVGVNGTPAFFVNGRMLSGAQPFESFKVVIDSELARNVSTTTH